MTWALKRQISCILILVLFVAAFAYLIISPRFQKEPTCADGRQNGAETGVDCGGNCARVCTAEADEISVVWARAFKVLPGRYNAVAYIVNHNENAAVENLNYRFRFGDERNIYIGKREGSTFIPPGGKFAVFEPGIDVGNSIPVYTTFEFTQAPVWLKVPEDKLEQLKILVSNAELSGETTNPRLSATVKNNSLFTIPNVGVVAILYEAGGNAVAVSRTYLPELRELETRNIYFTWPEPIIGEVVAKEVIPIFDIFSAKLK